MKTTRVILQIEPALKAAGEKAAAAAHRSLSGLVEMLLAVREPGCGRGFFRLGVRRTQWPIAWSSRDQ
jgi:hypothetical protein